MVVAAVHNKLDAGGDGAEFPDDEFVAREIEQVLHVFFKIGHVFKIVIVGIIAYEDVGVFDDVF